MPETQFNLPSKFILIIIYWFYYGAGETATKIVKKLPKQRPFISIRKEPELHEVGYAKHFLTPQTAIYHTEKNLGPQ